MLGPWRHPDRVPQHFRHAAGQHCAFAASNDPGEATPCRDISPFDDLRDRGLGQIAAGLFGEVSVRHEGFVQWGRMSLEHQAYNRAQTGDLNETELTQLARFQGRKGGTPDAGLCRELTERETLRAPPLGDQTADGLQVHRSNVLDDIYKVQYIRLTSWPAAATQENARRCLGPIW